MLRKINFSPENYYHIYNRGTDKREIFLNQSDYLRFTALLYICNNNKPVDIREMRITKILETHEGRSFENFNNLIRKQTIVNIGMYCLMPNHFHLLIREKENNGISNFMKKLSTAYAMYFNKKYERSGNLFQGRFKAELVNNDEYLRYLFAYIHLNPIKLIEPDWKESGIKNSAHAIKFLKEYKWSSCSFYMVLNQKNAILNSKEFPKYFANFHEFQDFINEWLNYKGRSFGSLEKI